MTDADFDASFESESMIHTAELHAVQQRGVCWNIDLYSLLPLGFFGMDVVGWEPIHLDDRMGNDNKVIYDSQEWRVDKSRGRPFWLKL